MDQSPDTLSFEDALAELEQTIARLEAGSLTLEASLALFERGQFLAERCGRLLDEAQLKVEQLTDDGEIVTITVDLEA
jgi:exodeoxyribonuclease VII small subunit